MSDGSFDVIVVGAGIVGLAHAYTAARRGLRVCVVERDAACVGASVRNFGFITVTGQAAGDTWRRARRARDVWALVAPQAGIPVLHGGLWMVARRPAAAEVLQQFMHTPMADGCQLLTPAQAAAHTDALSLADAQAVLYSPHELRVESRTAIGQLARWLAEVHGVQFRFKEAVLDVQAPRVQTSRGVLQAERVVLCTHTDLHGLQPERLAPHGLRLCQLQMLRVQPPPGYRLPGAVAVEESQLAPLDHGAVDHGGRPSIAVLPFARELNLLTRGEVTARALGVRVGRLRGLVYGLGSLLTAVAVTTIGSVGFVGLIVPHLVRLAIGNDQRLLLPAATLAGGVLLCAADTAARTVVAPIQLPVGVLTALFGVPVFLFLLARHPR